MPEVREYAKSLPNVVVADENLFTCSQDTQEKMKHVINEYGLNRVVVASCSPRTHEFLFRTTIREAGLNKYLFEMANIRDQCSWVHMKDKENATKKAKTLVRMAVTNANYIKPLKEVAIGVNKSALVFGGGLAGMTAALKLAGQNFEVFLVEKEAALGGNLRHIYSTLDGMDVQEFLANLTEQVVSHPLIHVHDGNDRGRPFRVSRAISRPASSTCRTKATTKAEARDHRGGDGRRGIEAEGPVRFTARTTRVMTQMELEERLAEKSAAAGTAGYHDPVRGVAERGAALLQPGLLLQRDKECDSSSRRPDPDTDVVILFRDVMTYGFLEKYYLKARKAGVRFVRYEKEQAARRRQRQTAG